MENLPPRKEAVEDSRTPTESTPKRSSRRKRMLGSPTGLTPKQPHKRAPTKISKGKRRLEFRSTSSKVVVDPWSKAEDKALVQFVLLTGTRWPYTKNTVYWESAAKFVAETCQDRKKRTSGGCRCRVAIVLAKRFPDPLQAEKHFGNDPPVPADSGSPISEESPSEQPPAEVESTGSPPSSEELCLSPLPVEVIDTMQVAITQFNRLPSAQKVHFLSEMLKMYAESSSDLTVPEDYLHLSLEAMKRLKDSNHINVLYELAKGLGTTRPDGSDSYFPTKRMPMGMLQYMVLFFNSKAGQQILCSEDYRLWIQSMYVLFGSKWSKLFCGPLWSIEATEQGSSSIDGSRDPLKARVNVPGLGERTVQRDIAGSQFTTGSEVQIAILDEASHLHPDERWWIKADGCDVVCSLEESLRLEWNGDVDLDDGRLQKLYHSYRQRLDGLEHLTKLRSDIHLVLITLNREESDITTDLKFISESLKNASDEYASKLSIGSTEKTLYSLGWKVDELIRLQEVGRQLFAEISSVRDLVMDPNVNTVAINVPQRLVKLKETLTSFIKGLFRYKRKPATHIFAVMISTESRNRKPYSLPLQCIPYASLTHKQVREIINKVISLMSERRMKVLGFVSNGEYNSMRAKGYTRPLSVLQIKAEARAKYSSLGLKTMLEMLTPIRQKDGQVLPLRPNDAVPTELLTEILQWREEGALEDDIVCRLRTRTVPPGYPIHSWKKDGDVTKEEKVEKVRSILSQLEYRYQVLKWDSIGVPFCTYMYVPEIHPISKTEYHEREDFGHVYKRMAHSTRLGGPPKLRLDRFTEALHDESSGLTFSALTGKRKQSIRDVEILFSERMQKFMERNKYSYEARYIQVVRNWRRACDERGLSQLSRCKFNYELLNFILEDFMPWYEHTYDFSLLEVNRKVEGVCGFSRETVIALTTNIESCEWKRRELVSCGKKGENPRASTTDDVECLFSVMRDLTGKHFTLRQAQTTWRKSCIEFAKRLDPNLGFYYHTSSHDRFYEGERPNFDESSKKRSSRNPRHQRVRRIEQPSHLMFGRATFATPGAKSVRTQFHNLPVDLPPPPLPKGAHHDIRVEHSYSKK